MLVPTVVEPNNVGSAVGEELHYRKQICECHNIKRHISSKEPQPYKLTVLMLLLDYQSDTKLEMELVQLRLRVYLLVVLIWKATGMGTGRVQSKLKAY